MTLRREKARLEGEVTALKSSEAETRSKISEAQTEIDRERNEFRMQVLNDLQEAEGKEGDLVEQETSALAQLRSTELRSPAAGIVHGLTQHTVGGVVGAGEVIMLVAPDNDTLQVEVEIQPKDIDQIADGQEALLRFAAFDRGTTPELHGTVSYVSPDAIRDSHLNTLAYDARITIGEDEGRRLGDRHLIAGMPAEVVFVTKGRTLLSYLMKPLSDQLARSFRGR
jgi:HlyD family secretion protein